MDNENVVGEFDAVVLDEDQAAYASRISTRFDELWSDLDHILPEGREKSLAKTNLQVAVGWAHRALKDL
jgi:hypothetical protein